MNKKEKGLMDMDNSVVIAGGREEKCNGKNTIMIETKQTKELSCLVTLSCELFLIRKVIS